MMLRISITFLVLCCMGFAGAQEIADNLGYFSGRIAKINLEASLVRFKLDFENKKYLSKRDKIEFWDEKDSTVRCSGYVLGKSNHYLLLKVPGIEKCDIKLNITVGAYLRFYSQDLKNNLEMGSELVDILLKKRLALRGQESKEKERLESFIEKIQAVNDRYEVLRKKLEAERREKIAAIEEDQLNSFQSFKEISKRLDELNFKLEQYEISEDNFKEDRWALDPRLYYKK